MYVRLAMTSIAPWLRLLFEKLRQIFDETEDNHDRRSCQTHQEKKREDMHAKLSEFYHAPIVNLVPGHHARIVMPDLRVPIAAMVDSR